MSTKTRVTGKILVLHKALGQTNVRQFRWQRGNCHTIQWHEGLTHDRISNSNIKVASEYAGRQLIIPSTHLHCGSCHIIALPQRSHCLAAHSDCAHQEMPPESATRQIDHEPIAKSISRHLADPVRNKSASTSEKWLCSPPIWAVTIANFLWVFVESEVCTVDTAVLPGTWPWQL